MAILNNSDIRQEHGVSLMGRVANNKDARDTVFLYLKTNVDPILYSRVGEDGILSVVSSFAKYFSTAQRLEEVSVSYI